MVFFWFEKLVCLQVFYKIAPQNFWRKIFNKVWWDEINCDETFFLKSIISQQIISLELFSKLSERYALK